MEQSRNKKREETAENYLNSKYAEAIIIKYIERYTDSAHFARKVKITAKAQIDSTFYQILKWFFGALVVLFLSHVVR